MKYKQMMYIVVAAVVMQIGIIGCRQKDDRVVTASTAETKKYERTDVAMGTVVSETIYSTGEDITADMITLLSEVENQYMSWRSESSEIAVINDLAGAKDGCKVSAETAGYLSQILEVSAKSDGAFDPTIGYITRLWDIDGEDPYIPRNDELQTLLKQCGYQKVELLGSQVTLESGVSLDLGAAGKGIGCDEVRTRLAEDTKVSGAVISVGGSILVYGEKPDQTPWNVAVTDPRAEDGFLGILTLTGEHYISTSGDYEKYFIEDEKRYHHIIDPQTGAPARSGLISVTVLSQNGLLSDALSTACFVLGAKESISLLAEYKAEAVFVDEDRNVYMTNGMKEVFSLTAKGYQIQEMDW